MKSDSKKIRKISEQVLNLIVDIRSRYIKEYNLHTPDWSNGLFQLYYLNCDMEIIRFLEKNNIEPNTSSVKFGISYGLWILKLQIITNYHKQYGINLDINIKEKMYNDINNAVIDFIKNGV